MSNVGLNDMKDIRPFFKSSLYELTQKVADGGVGHVYLANQLNTGQQVVIKCLLFSQTLSEPKRQKYRDRFYREMALCGQLNHANIARPIDKGHCGDRLLFAVFDYIDGVSLKEWLLENGALEPSVVCAIMGQVLDGLAHAHSLGIIHRDLKPANIMLSHDDGQLQVRIVDVGTGALGQEIHQQHCKTIAHRYEMAKPRPTAPQSNCAVSLQPVKPTSMYGDCCS